MNYNVGVIAGDGNGPEIVSEARKVLDAIGAKFGHTFTYDEILMGGCSIDATGVPLTDDAIAHAKAADAVLMGSIGGNTATSPWYKLEPSLRPEAGLLKLRKALNLFANLRPAYLYRDQRNILTSWLHLKWLQSGLQFLFLRYPVQNRRLAHKDRISYHLSLQRITFRWNRLPYLLHRIKYLQTYSQLKLHRTASGLLPTAWHSFYQHMLIC